MANFGQIWRKFTFFAYRALSQFSGPVVSYSKQLRAYLQHLSEAEPWLVPGDEIAIGATARPVSPSQVEAAVGFWERSGFRVRIPEGLCREDEVFAGSIAHRLQQLQALLDDPAVKLVHFARGGYGTTHLLDKLSLRQLYRHPKCFIGFSDLTPLLNWLAGKGFRAAHGPMAGFIGQDSIDPKTWEVLLGFLLEQEFPMQPLSVVHWPAGCALPQRPFPVFGGNLSLLAHTQGTKYSPRHTARGLLFVEEVSEYKYQLERLAYQLLHSGMLHHCAGLLLGDFSDVQDNPEPFGKSVEEIFRGLVEKVSRPLITGFPAGHCAFHQILPLSGAYQLKFS